MDEYELFENGQKLVVTTHVTFKLGRNCRLRCRFTYIFTNSLFVLSQCFCRIPHLLIPNCALSSKVNILQQVFVCCFQHRNKDLYEICIAFDHSLMPRMLMHDCIHVLLLTGALSEESVTLMAVHSNEMESTTIF